ncbi:MAG TPA: DUF4097 family beta strand repeat-containing protein [Trebonia sp.]
MPSWTVDSPVNMDFDDVTTLNVRLIGGTVAVLAAGDKPSLEVTEVRGRPLQVEYSSGTLTISYEKLSWERLLDLLKPMNDRASVTVAVPADCPVQLGVVSASALVSGLSAGTSVKGVSGDITLDGIAGAVVANTVSGELLARDIDGTVRFATVSGELTLADSALSGLSAESVSGRVTADVTLDSTGSASVSTVAGDVTLRLPADSDAAVRLNTVSGKVATEFASLQVRKAPASRVVFGNVGAGTGHVSISTLSGAITLLRCPDRRTMPDRGDNPSGVGPQYFPGRHPRTPQPPRRSASGPRAQDLRDQAGMESETR